MATEVIVTVKPGGGGNYTTISSAEAGEQRDLVAVDEISIIECDAAVYAEALTFSTWTTDATRYPVLRAAAGAEHLGVPDAGCVLTNSSAVGVLLSIESVPYFRCENFQINGSGAASPPAIQFSTSNFCQFTNILSVDEQRTACVQNVSGTSGGTFRNCLFIRPRVGFQSSNGSQIAAYNCTIIDASDDGYKAGAFSSPNYDYRNCVSYGATNQDFDIASWLDADSTNNASGDTTANDAIGGNGSGAVTGVTTADFVDYAGGDYRAAPGGLLEGAGADLSVVGVTDDIVGNPRVVPYEIGCYEIPATGGVTFDGPDIVNQTGTENQVFNFDENGEGTVASRFTGASSYALSPDSDPLPTGLSVNPTTGNIEGTPTEVVTRTIIIRGSE